MRRAIATHRQDFIAIVALVVSAVAVTAYIFRHQPAFTFGHSYYTVRAEFANAAAVTAGQGQAVTEAGVQVGQIGGVGLDHGRAVVTMNIYTKYKPIYANATVLLRPRTPLKDMYLALDPGTKDAGAIPNNGELGVASTNPTVDLSQILSTLDADTRNYLLLLLSGGAQAFRDLRSGSTAAALGDPASAANAPSPAAVADLRGTFKRFAPLGRDTVTFASLLATRERNISRAIHNFQLVARSLGSVENELASLIDSSNTNFSAISSQDANLESALSLLPGTLVQTNQTLGKVQTFATQSGHTLHQLLPFAHAFGPALQASEPLFRDTTPVIRDQLRPFAVAVQPVARILEPAAIQLARATPPLTRSLAVLNTLFNTLAFQPAGSEQGYLFWGAWLSHIADSLIDTQDANGPVMRGIVMAPCGQLQLFNGLVRATTSLAVVVDLLGEPDVNGIPGCGGGALG